MEPPLPTQPVQPAPLAIGLQVILPPVPLTPTVAKTLIHQLLELLPQQELPLPMPSVLLVLQVNGVPTLETVPLVGPSMARKLVLPTPALLMLTSVSLPVTMLK
jgi:hypothetical protein